MKNHYICCQNYLPSAPPVKKGKQLFVNIERRCDDGWTVPCHLNSFMGIARIFGDNYDGNDDCDPVWAEFKTLLPSIWELCDNNMMDMMMIATPCDLREEFQTHCYLESF